MPNDFAESIASSLSTLSGPGKAGFLARLIHQETIHVRVAHYEDPGEVASLYASSEFVHRLSGCIMHVLSHETDSDYSQSLAGLIDSGVHARSEGVRTQILGWLADG